MEYRVVEQHRYSPHCFIILGGSSYDSNTDAIAMKWKDSNGHFSRPAGEMDAPTFLQAVEVAVREGLVTHRQALEAVVAGIAAAGHP